MNTGSRSRTSWALGSIFALAAAATATAEPDPNRPRDDRVCAIAFERSGKGGSCELLRSDYQQQGEIEWCEILALCVRSWSIRSEREVIVDWVENRELVRLHEVERLRS